MPSHPYKPFFLIAALDATLGIVVWLPWVSMSGRIDTTGTNAGDWHRNVLLFGTIPAILAGFLLTALPRWTGRPVVPPPLPRGLVGLWLGARVASLISTAAGLALSATFMLAVSSIAAAQIIAARDRRDFKVLGLLCAFCGSIMLTATGGAPASYRLAVASLLGLVMVIGGRVTPALTCAFLGGRGVSVDPEPSRAVEGLSAALAGAALIVWVLAPQHPATGILGAGAAVVHAVRLLRWRGWRSLASASVTVLHIGYGWIAVGFILLGLHVLNPDRFSQAAAVHAWTIGAIGTMSIAIMSSMIRKHSRRPFSRNGAAAAAFVSITVSAVARILAEAFPDWTSAGTQLSATFWIAAFVLFLWAFRDVLLRR
jgi:uncharacterized protein involved in response to NO